MKRAKDISKTKNNSKTTARNGTAHIISPDDRAAAGKALREKVPREWHGEWKEFRGRLSPIDPSA